MKKQHSSIVVLGIHILLLMLAVLLAVLNISGGMRGSLLLDMETAIYIVLLAVNIPLSVVCLILAAKKRFSKGITAWIVTLSVVNILISLLVWAAVLLVGGMIALAFMQK
jgi:hypothetical protein